jgi:3-ketosteroid 9alpha-monooxygenase subunit B
MGEMTARSPDDDHADHADHADHDDTRRAHGFHAVGVRSVVQETVDTRSFVLDVPAELTEAFRYRAGQFCTFRVGIDDGEHLRSYSMSSAPETDADLTVTVKRVAGGVVSNWFNDHVAAGDVLEATRPAGVFCVRDGDRPVVAFCGGSGITPVMSIAKSVLATTERAFRLLYANRDRGSVIFDEQLGSLAAGCPERMELRHHFDSDGGFLDASAIGRFAAGSVDADFYICGPGPFMDLVEATLLGMGVEPERISIERFDGPSESSGGPPVAADVPDGDAEVPEKVTIILGGTKTTIDYRAGDTVLETARRGGLRAPFSCEAGNCATCMAIVREGSATMRANNALTADEVEEGWILTCQALPRCRSVTVEYEAF